MDKTKLNFEELSNYMSELDNCTHEAREVLGSISKGVERLGQVGIVSGAVRNSLDVISGVIESTGNKISSKLINYKGKIQNVYATAETLEANFNHVIENYLGDFISPDHTLFQQIECFESNIVPLNHFTDGGVSNLINGGIIAQQYVVKKPLIYLYPKNEQNVSVKLLHEDKLKYTYPKYDGSWNVFAKPNGDLLDLKTNRNLYGLYWEGLNNFSNGVKEDGFVVNGKDTISFLENKLGVLGLNEREANEFIIYWLPQLENNEYNYIRFTPTEVLNINMPLEIFPKPDTLIRVNMEFKKLNEKINVVEQELITPNRSGFVVVEWGGTEL